MKSDEYYKHVAVAASVEVKDPAEIQRILAEGPGPVIFRDGPEPTVGWAEGVKFDQGKPRHDLLPPELSDAVARVLTFGAAKYGERNWEKGMRWGRPFAALMRHLWAWWRGERTDPETGMSHLWHAACCLAFLIAYEARGTGTDDRPKADT